eukprot:UN02349
MLSLGINTFLLPFVEENIIFLQKLKSNTKVNFQDWIETSSTKKMIFLLLQFTKIAWETNLAGNFSWTNILRKSPLWGRQEGACSLRSSTQFLVKKYFYLRHFWGKKHADFTK